MVIQSLKWLQKQCYTNWTFFTVHPSALPPMLPLIHTTVNFSNWWTGPPSKPADSDIGPSLFIRHSWASNLSSLLHLSRSTYRTRSSELIKLINRHSRTNFGRNSFNFAAAFDWNTIQDTLKLTAFTSQSAFKQKLNYVLVDPPCSF